ncbi:methyl-accepting chemotaxis protein [Nitrospira lenta]|uniref:HAMP domain-containing protein n=1 Tax=Nitrospira lenta TaxID=1436998 RepID=A0A330L1X9_9BACT|nr:methyl-accepting chemotaxis protein [Nitrospira lenta]SPP63249.1 hypothetical protein NITLEN_10335 [Nitrospira lenta]
MSPLLPASSNPTPFTQTPPVSSLAHPPSRHHQSKAQDLRAQKHRLTFMHPLQVRMLSLVLSYTTMIALLLAVPVFRPFMQALDNPALSWQERAAVATDLLNLHARYWPWALGAGSLLVLHCLHSLRMVHRIAGPLDRFKQLYQEIGEGNLSRRAILRPHDYLTPEADLLNRMTAQLQARVSATKQAQTTLALDVERLKETVARERNPIFTTLVQQTEQDLASLKESLDWFKTHTG